MDLSRRTFAKMGIAGTVAVGATGLLSLPACSGRPPSRIPVAAIRARSVVLVHGLYADGSSWIDVVPYLQAAGLNVAVVQNPLSTLTDAAAETLRVLSQQPGPVVLGGHSWSGTLVSEVGIEPSVSALVYIAARAPDAHEDFPALSKRFPTPPASAGVVVSPDGYAELDEATFLRDFAGGVPAERAPRSVPFRDAIAAPCPLSARPWPPGAISRAGIRCPPRTGPSTRISNVSLPNGWARTRSNSIPRTFRSSLSPSRSPG
jgi:pimeloyl-ACP methyl ester carboxylesterase